VAKRTRKEKPPFKDNATKQKKKKEEEERN